MLTIVLILVGLAALPFAVATVVWLWPTIMVVVGAIIVLVPLVIGFFYNAKLTCFLLAAGVPGVIAISEDVFGLKKLHRMTCGVVAVAIAFLGAGIADADLARERAANGYQPEPKMTRVQKFQIQRASECAALIALSPPMPEGYKLVHNDGKPCESIQSSSISDATRKPNPFDQFDPKPNVFDQFDSK
jgi:hypothetical protein